MHNTCKLRPHVISPISLRFHVSLHWKLHTMCWQFMHTKQYSIYSHKIKMTSGLHKTWIRSLLWLPSSVTYPPSSLFSLSFEGHPDEPLTELHKPAETCWPPWADHSPGLPLPTSGPEQTDVHCSVHGFRVTAWSWPVSTVILLHGEKHSPPVSRPLEHLRQLWKELHGRVNQRVHY